MELKPKKLGIVVLFLSGLSVGTSVQAGDHTVSVGYAQSKVQDFKNIQGVNIQYRYEWDSPVSMMGTFTYMKGDDSGSYTDYYGDSYTNHVDVKYYSFLAGPAYRINDFISFYGLIGVAHTKVSGGYEWHNSVGANSVGGHDSGDLSGKSTSFAYAAGFTINPYENLSVNVGYEGSKANVYGKRSINGFNVGMGYHF